MQNPRRVVGITLGDPAGIGPEIIEKALQTVASECRGGVLVRVYGPKPICSRLARIFDICEAYPTSEDLEGIEPGIYSKASGSASISALSAAIAHLVSGEIEALVTAPISKLALRDAGLLYPGQTEWLQDAFKAKKVAMLLFGSRLRVALVTTHIPLSRVPKAITVEKVVTTALLLKDFLKDYLGLQNPKIGVVSLNPHASDDGMFGDEEQKVLKPAILTLKELGIRAEGPLPADTAFYEAFRGEFDGLVSMFHDQGLPPLKLVHFDEAVNVTLGLPRLRCSPDHGPAYSIVNQGIASERSMVQALRLSIGHVLKRSL
jgi:4-hydroxythreonine-4-phosphate dehydrogenase